MALERVRQDEEDQALIVLEISAFINFLFSTLPVVLLLLAAHAVVCANCRCILRE
jgi:hypothetical protein